MSLTVVVALLTGLMVTCAPAATPAPPGEEPAAEPAAEEPAAEEPAAEQEELYTIYLTPSTESGYWGEYVRIGVENAILDIEEQCGVTVNYDRARGFHASIYPCWGTGD